jgi:small subunit ribosomal protein SAe
MTSVASGSKVLRATQADVQKLLVSRTHLGTKNCSNAMNKYVYARTKDGIHIIDIHMTWEKLILAARILAAVENTSDICVCSTRLFGQRAIFKFAQALKCQYIGGRFIPGTFTNYIQSKFMQPRVLIITDPRTDHQALNEARLANIPVIAFTDTDSPLQFVDVAIPCNNRGRHSIAMMYWLLAREVLRMKGDISRTIPWETKVDLFFYRNPDEEAKKEEANKAGETKKEGYNWANRDEEDYIWENNNYN